MNVFVLIKRLSGAYLVRCKYWGACGLKHCRHYEPHRPGAICVMNMPVKYCPSVGGFVYDLPMSDLDADYECDPNLAFKAKRDAEARFNEKESKYHAIRSR